MSEDWQDDFEKGFISVDEGVHDIVILGEPEQQESRFNGKLQWVFDAKVDGIPGFLSPSKTLGKIISAEFAKNNKEWPIAFRIERTGMSLDTKIKVIE